MALFPTSRSRLGRDFIARVTIVVALLQWSAPITSARSWIPANEYQAQQHAMRIYVAQTSAPHLQGDIEDDEWFAMRYAEMIDRSWRLNRFFQNHGALDEAGRPLDVWGRPLAALRLGLIRCVGPNGVDDGGELDDWEVSFHGRQIAETGPRWEYWFAQERSQIYWRVSARVVVALALFAAIVSLRRVNFASLSTWAIIVGHLGATLVPSNMVIFNEPAWIDICVAASKFTFYIGVLALAAAIVLAVDRFVVRMCRSSKDNRCLECGYDFEGLTSDRCPECGTAIDEFDEAPTWQDAESAS